MNNKQKIYGEPCEAQHHTTPFMVNHNTIQTIQNNALQIITGCTQITPTNHLLYETWVFTLQDHINMRGTQFLATASANLDHPCHYMLAHQPTPHSIKTTPQALYTGLLNTIPWHSSSHIHTHFTNIDIQKTRPQHNIRYSSPHNTSLRTRTQRVDRIHLSRLRYRHHTALATYQKRIDDSVDEVYTHCHTVALTPIASNT